MNKKKYLLLFDFVFSVFLLFAETVNSISTSNTSFTSTDNIKKAQVATATNEYIVTAGDIYTLVYAGGSFSVSVDSTYDYADGFTPFAQKDNIEVSHYIEKTGVYKASYYNETDLLSTIPLTSYDRIYIPSVKDTKSVIYVEGAVNNKYNSDTKTVILDKDEVLPSGEVVSSPTSMNKLKFEYSEGKSFVSFILENSAMFINSSDLENAYIIRQNDESDETIPVNIGNILYPSKKDKEFTDFEINANDRIIIPYTQYYVTVTGGVNSVGKYAYQPGKTWEYYINLADGFNLDENLFSSVKITDKNGKKLSKKSEIPPEAVIYASRNSPNNGWLIPLITSILTFITTCLTLIGTIMNFS